MICKLGYGYNSPTYKMGLCSLGFRIHLYPNHLYPNFFWDMQVGRRWTKLKGLKTC